MGKIVLVCFFFCRVYMDFVFSYRICSPQVIRVPREEDYRYIQKQILRSLGPAVPDDVIYRADVSLQ